MAAVPQPSKHLIQLAREKWAGMGQKAKNRLVLPGTPSFHCAPQRCDTMCCRSPYLAGISVWDIEQLERAGHETVPFIDLEGGPPDQIVEVLEDRESLKSRPLRQLSLRLRRGETERCIFLKPAGGCGVYDDRPNGCAQYPFLITFVPRDGRLMVTQHMDSDALDRSVRIAAGLDSAAAGLDDAAAGLEDAEPEYVPLLLRDPACPGFSGERLSPKAYAALLWEIWTLSACSARNLPCARHPHPVPEPSATQ